MSDDIKFACEKCGQSVSVASVHAGASLFCPGCGGPLTVPTEQPGASPASAGTGGISANRDATNAEHKPGELVVNRYRLERILGRGGMGVVWLANDEQLGEPVALKFVPPEIRSDKDALKDLRRETLKSRKLSHPSIIRIHDLNQTEGVAPFISMEFVAGETMSSLRGKQPNSLFTWDALRPLVTQLCAALDYAHSQGIVHRDLKPANLMVTESGQVKLADFGIAATISDTMGRVSLDNLSSGTPTYMSPQQIEGFPPSARDDVYALGATLYDLLTTKPPFFRGKIIHQVLNVAPVTPEQRLQELGLTNAIPPEVSAAIMACLVKDSDQRLPSVAAVMQALGLIPGGLASSPAVSVGTTSQPPAAEPPTEIAAGSQVSNRKMVYWLAATAALVLLLGGLTMVFNRNKPVAEPPSAKGQSSNSVAPQPQGKPTATTAGTGSTAPSAPAMASRDKLATGLWSELFTNGKPSGATYEFFADQTLVRYVNGQSRKSTWRWIDAPARTILVETDGNREMEVVIAPDGKSASVMNRNGARPVWVRPEPSATATPSTSSPSAVTAAKTAPFVNTLGMKFVPVPGTKVFFSIWDTRVRDYEAYAKAQEAAGKQVDGSWKTQDKEGVPIGREADHPVVAVSWDDAQAFCAWLTSKEQAEDKLPKDMKYRLPSDDEWSTAVGLPPEQGATPEAKHGKNSVDFPWGKDWPPPAKVGNYADEAFHAQFPKPDPKNPRFANPWIAGYTDGYATTSPVGSFAANAHGLHDMGGNVWQWCEDWWNTANQERVLRGNSFPETRRERMLSSVRHHTPPGVRYNNHGFRCVLAPTEGLAQASLTSPASAPSPAAASEPSTAKQKIDLLALVDLQRDTVAGQWARTNGELVSLGSTDRPFVIAFPVKNPPDEYDLRFRLRREQGFEMKFFFSDGVARGAFRTDVWTGNRSNLNETKLHFVGDDLGAITRPKRLFQDGQPHDLTIRVRKNLIDASYDGASVLKREGGLAQLKAGMVTDANSPLFGISKYAGELAVMRAELVPVSARTVFSNFVPTAVWRDAMSGAWSPAWKLVGTERHQISTVNALHQLPQVGPNSGIRARIRSQNPKEFFDLLLRMKPQENSRRYGVTMWTHGVQGSELFILNREGKQTKLAKFTSPATLGVNVEHSAEFYAVGNRLTFFFDGKLIASADDTTFSDGHPAIFAGPGIEIISLETAGF